MAACEASLVGCWLSSARRPCYIASMPVQNILCISIDGLRASALGTYGNTWHPTPALDLLASQSHVLDWMFCHRPTLDGFFDATWPLISRLADAGFKCALTTDDAAVAKRGESSGFDEIRRIEFTADQSAPTVADTELAQLFALGIDQLESWPAGRGANIEVAPRRLLWLHARAYRGAWDAPIDLRASLLDDEDLPPPTFVVPIALTLTHDHDELLLHRVAYAAQTMVLDECIEALMSALTGFGLDQDTLVVLVGTRGFALGEHGAAGSDADALFSELLHVPCLIRLPNAESPPPRASLLAQPADLPATLIPLLELPAQLTAAQGANLLAPDAGGSPSRQFLIATNHRQEHILRTPAWMLRKLPVNEAPNDAIAGASGVELYLKPDDYWEANEVADRLPDVTARLLEVLGRVLESGHVPAIPPDLGLLDEDLISHAIGRA
jgi:hypothetical protein